MDSTDLLPRIVHALAPFEFIRAALLFGSRASGRARRDSDIDVAVLLDERAAEGDRKRLLWSLLGALGQTLRADRVDLVVLNDAPTKLAFHVLREGKVAFERDPVALHRFRVRTYSRHADYQPIERLFREATKRRAQAAVRVG